MLSAGRKRNKANIYEKTVKRVLDKGLSFAGLVVLAPVNLLIIFLIFLDDPGPVFFTQKRVGKNKKLFMCHKFRTMKRSTPHDVPTHQLKNPEQYITRMGRFLRKTSLDELPQIWDIFQGKMSIIGPRPALWNQDDLVAERDKYGANDILPGLTGWAQINGRDELGIKDKARLDGEYVKKLKQGGVRALFFDARCFLGTIGAVAGSRGVVEGGTGELHRKECREIVYKDIETIPQKRKKILITGKDSYIGRQVKEYLEQESEFYVVDSISTIGWQPDVGRFIGYDVVFNVAGIAHIKETNENRSLYYEVNRELAINIAKAAKTAGVEQLIVLSSMSVYGKNIGEIRKDTVPFPVSAYGESKLAADEEIERLADRQFKVAILRPPMVYGKGCKGNYQMLRKFALYTPLFPACKNQRSMIYIGNLCEFVKRTIDNADSGLFFPQNCEYVNTADMVKLVAAYNGKKVRFVYGIGPLLKRFPVNIVEKVFGDLTYEKVDMVGRYSFDESIKETET